MGYPVPDDQGNSSLCSVYALVKAIFNGFIVGKYEPYQQLDFDQSLICSVMAQNIDEVDNTKHVLKDTFKKLF